MSEIKPWEVLEKRHLADYRVFRVRADITVCPRNGSRHEFYVIECSNWVNVIALTPDRRVVMVHQFRHGVKHSTLELPGGLIDPSDASPAEAALRELREETGYTGRNARVIGQMYPNPAVQENLCFTVLVEDCVKAHETEFDEGEDLATELVPLEEVDRIIAENRVGHALIIAAFHLYGIHQRRPG